LNDTNVAPGALVARLWDFDFDDTNFFATVPFAITNAGWQHVALSVDYPSVRIYTNGHLAASGTLQETEPLSTSGDLYFGYHAATNADATFSFQGGLDEFSVYERALCDCEIATIAGVTNRGKYGTNAKLSDLASVASQMTLKKRTTPPMIKPTAPSKEPTVGRVENSAEKPIITRLAKRPTIPIRISKTASIVIPAGLEGLCIIDMIREMTQC